jgi:hypothetical protein
MGGKKGQTSGYVRKENDVGFQSEEKEEFGWQRLLKAISRMKRTTGSIRTIKLFVLHSSRSFFRMIEIRSEKDTMVLLTLPYIHSMWCCTEFDRGKKVTLLVCKSFLYANMVVKSYSR